MLFEKTHLEPDEKVLKIVRPHWFVITIELFIVFVVAILPLFALFAVALLPDSIMPTLFEPGQQLPAITFGLATWLLLTLMGGFLAWTDYYLDLWIITDRRIMVIDQISFFNRSISIFRLERLQDIEVTVKGFLQTFLNFGTISAQTASSSMQNFESPNMPDPRGLQRLIQTAMDDRMQIITLKAHETDH
jgi:hypothetical protein